MPALARITHDPNIMGGKPCIRGLRVTVGMIVGLVAGGRSNEEILRLYPASAYFQEHEWKALYCYIKRTNVPPAETVSLNQAVRWIAQLGGFLGRKGDGHPGPITLWRGLHRLQDIAEASLVFNPSTCG